MDGNKINDNEKNSGPVMITFETDEGPSQWYIIDQTRISGCNYILVADNAEGDAECMILKDTAADSDKDSVYEEVTDEDELYSVAGIFEESLGDVDIV